jgi:hypothetical protein
LSGEPVRSPRIQSGADEPWQPLDVVDVEGGDLVRGKDHQRPHGVADTGDRQAERAFGEGRGDKWSGTEGDGVSTQERAVQT